MTLITPSPNPANGWYGSNIFGAGGWGLSSGGFPNGFGGGFGFGGGTPSIQSAWGNQVFVPTSQQQTFATSPQQAPQSSPGVGGGSFPSGGSALSGGGTASPSSLGGGSPFGSGGGFLDGGASFSGGGSPFPSGGAGAGPGQSPQFSALSSSLGSGGSITPQYAQLADSLGFSPAEAQAFASSSGGFNQANLPSQNAGEMMGGLGPSGLPGGNNFSLAQIIQSEAGDSQAGQFAVAAVLANRADNPTFSQFGDLLGQANAPGQFTGHLVSPSGPGRVVPQSQVGASAQDIAQALQNGTLGNFGQLGNALYFLAQTSPDGALMAKGGAAPIGGGTAATNNVFSNSLSSRPAPGFSPPQYTLGAFTQAGADPFGTAFGGIPGLPANANFAASGFPILPSGANGFGYPAYGASTMSDSLLGNLGFSTGGDYTSQMLDHMGLGYGDAGLRGRKQPA